MRSWDVCCSDGGQFNSFLEVFPFHDNRDCVKSSLAFRRVKPSRVAPNHRYVIKGIAIADQDVCISARFDDAQLLRKRISSPPSCANSPAVEVEEARNPKFPSRFAA